jgi:hypothetical protein
MDKEKGSKDNVRNGLATKEVERAIVDFLKEP